MASASSVLAAVWTDKDDYALGETVTQADTMTVRSITQLYDFEAGTQGWTVAGDPTTSQGVASIPLFWTLGTSADCSSRSEACQLQAVLGETLSGDDICVTKGLFKAGVSVSSLTVSNIVSCEPVNE